MKIMVRVIAEAETTILDKEVVKLENIFTQYIATAIVEKLKTYSPVGPDMPAGHEKRSRIKAHHLKDSWAFTPRAYGNRAPRGMGARSIYSRLPYAYYLAKGTGIYGPHGHPILPVNKKVMSFYWSFMRRWVVTRQVAGINPARFQSEVLNRSQREGTILGVSRAIAEQEQLWRGSLKTRLILL